MRLALAPCLLALLLPLTAVPAPVPTERDEKIIALMADLDRKRADMKVPGLAIAIVSGDELIHAEGLGLADVEQQRPATPRTVFAIGSTTKAFTSALTAMHVEKKRIDWDEPLAWYLPEFDLAPQSEDETARITFRDALSHRSGFARMGALWAGGSATPELIYRTASRAQPVAEFRKEFHYNNVVYTAAGDALARAAGRPWDVLMKKRLLRPLGMRTATLSIEAAQQDDHLAVGYAWDEDLGKFRELPMRDLRLVAPAGAINGTVLDVARWIRFQLARGVIDGKRLLSAEALEATWEPQVQIADESAYALGWMVHHRNGRRVVEHGGNIDGFAAQVTLYPDDDLGYVLLMNTSASPLQQVSIEMVASALLDEAPEEPAEGGASESLEDYVGDYVANFASFKNATFAVSVVDEKLHVDVPGQMNFELKPPGEDGKRSFAITDQIAVSFDRDEKGRVTGMKMYQGGLTFELPREGFEKPAAAFPEEWARYLGRYRSPSLNAEVTALAKDGQLALDVPGQMVFELKPPVDGRWNFRVSDALQVEFETDPEGQVTAIRQYRGGALVETWPRTGDAAAAASGDLDAVLELVRADARREAFEALGVVRMSGTVDILSSGLSGKNEVLVGGKDRYREVMDASPFLTSRTVVNGDEMSVESNVQRDSGLTEQQRRHLRNSHPLSLFADWRVFFDRIEYAEAAELDGRACHVVTLQQGDSPSIRVHVDAKTGDVLKAETSEPLGRGMPSIPIEVRFRDHRDLGGLSVPRVMEVSNDHTGTTVVAWESITAGVTAPPDAFAVN